MAEKVGGEKLGEGEAEEEILDFFPDAQSSDSTETFLGEKTRGNMVKYLVDKVGQYSDVRREQTKEAAGGSMAGMEQRKKVQPLSFLSGVRYEHLVAGVGGGLVSTLVLHPLDLLKIRFAVHDGQPGSQRPHYAGLSSAVRSIAGTEGGIRGLYAGVTPNLVGAGSAWGLYFFFYNGVKHQLQGGVASKQLPASSALLAASFSGVLTLTLTNPVWVVKTRLCLQSARLDPSTDLRSNPRLYRGFFDALYKIAWYEGLRGLYSGYVPGLFGVSHGVVQFVAYEDLKNRYHNFYNQPITTKLGTAEYLTFAAISKLVAALTTYPYQVVRARLQDQQNKYSGSLDCISKILRLEGIKGFYKGLSPNLLRVVPATMITFVVYENISFYLLKRTEEREKVVGIVNLEEGKQGKS